MDGFTLGFAMGEFGNDEGKFGETHLK